MVDMLDLIKDTATLNFADLDFSIKATYMEVIYTPGFYVVGDHYHKACEIYINLSGDVSFMIENKLYPIKRGSVTIARPNEFHHCFYNNSCTHKHFWLLIKYKKGNPLFEIFSKKNIGNFLQLDENSLNQVSMICKRLIEKKQGKLFQVYDVLSLLTILNSANHKSGINLLKDYPDVSRAIDYIHKNFTEPITVHEIAEFAHASLSSLERNFKKSINKTPMKYLKELRYTHAVELIKAGKNISEACSQSGLNDYSRFINEFKTNYGQTPKQYQKKLFGKK